MEGSLSDKLCLCSPIARQRLGKHFPAVPKNPRNNKTVGLGVPGAVRVVLNTQYAGKGKSITILYYLIWDSSNLEGQVPVFISRRSRVAQLYPRSLGSLYVVSYDSQGYGGGILTLPLPGGTGPCIHSIQE
jgi:hypothetical protein